MTALAKTKITTRDHMVQAAFDLFHRKGVHNTSVNDILVATGTGKSQFYHYFGSKEGLILTTVDSVTAWVKSNPVDVPYPFEIKNWRDMEQWFDFFIRVCEISECRKGSPLTAIGQNLDGEMPQVRDKIATLLKYIRSRISTFLDNKIRSGEISGDPDRLATLAMSVVEGGMVIAKIEQNITPLKDAVQEYKNYIRALQAK